MSSARLFFLCLLPALGFAQVPSAPPRPLVRNTEPGLEKAVKWKWEAVPSTGAPWGETPENAVAIPTPVPTAAPGVESASTYEVKSGDRLVHIARKFGITVVQLKGFNNLTTDLIRVGQVLNIPTIEQAIAIAPMPVVKPPPGQKKAPAPTLPGGYQPESLALQVFLDRQNFSVGSINGKPGPVLDRLSQIYRKVHPEFADPAALIQKAQAALPDVFTTYTLRAEDLQFIIPPRALRAEASTASASRPGANGGPLYQEIIASAILAYHTPWEFVAERFHCDESFLRAINAQITAVPQVGTQFRVPRVIPFEIESCLIEPIQPAAAEPIAANIEDLTMLEISKNGSVIAAMPVTSARPGLRGRGTWTILNAIPRPRLATKQEPTATPTPAPALFGSTPPAATPTPTPLPSPEYIPAGPNSPVGIIWINLAKADSPDPLPYGLHGTGVPDQLKQMDSIGGFRMANWNIARAVRLLPAGTPLTWRSLAAAPAAPPPNAPVAPAAPVNPPPPAISVPPPASLPVPTASPSQPLG